MFANLESVEYIQSQILVLESNQTPNFLERSNVYTYFFYSILELTVYATYDLFPLVKLAFCTMQIVLIILSTFALFLAVYMANFFNFLF